MKTKHYFSLKMKRVGMFFAVIPVFGWCADIDIYGPTADGTAPNVMFLLDNTSNWSSNNQNWNAGDSWNLCKNWVGLKKTECQNLIETVYYRNSYGQTIPTSTKKRPWDTGYAANKDNVELTQGQVQLRALKLVLNKLVCESSAPLGINIGVSMVGDSGSVLSNGHATGYIRFAIQKLSSSPFSPAPTYAYVNPANTAQSAASSCTALMNDFNYIDDKITNPTFKAPSNANYGAAMFEIFKYFGGHTNPTLAPEPPPNGASPTGPNGYGPKRFSNPNSLDDKNAFTDAGKSTYKSPISGANNCGANYIVLVGNTYPNAEANNGGPTIFSGINYTPPALNPTTSDTSRFADEWSYFLANTDVSHENDIQRVYTFTINTYKDKPSTDQTKLLKSMAKVGGTDGGYFEVNGSLTDMVDAFENALVNIAAVNSVFTATTLPVSTTTQGTFLNQIFVGMFRPDANFSPRWLGNLKQYKLGFIGDQLELLGANGQKAVSTGFFDATAVSYWTHGSVFFSESPSGTPASPSDTPDGAIVEKGGAAQVLRVANLQNASTRNLFTLPSSPSSGVALSATPFSTTNSNVTTNFTSQEIAWVRGENNVTTGPGVEDFNGSYLVGSTVTPLGNSGARHSMHGDVLHSRPVALNYGGGDVMVYYGTNDGIFHAVDGNRTGGTAGQELWSFVAPEHYPLLKRLRTGTPELQLPETNSAGGTITPPSGSAPKDYGMDGPIGVYTKYSSSDTLNEAIIYPAMRRGGRTVYAFDVTSKSAPKFLWKITGGTGDYTKLGQTWSMPKPVVLPTSTTPPVILVMGGGYDPKEDQNTTSSPKIGNAVFIINGRTGALIKEISTTYSVPSDVALVDINYDGVPDRAYVADVRGNLYRIDFPSYTNVEDLATSSAWSGVTAKTIAELDGKVFYPPDVVAIDQFVAVLVGTGDREKPLLNSTNDHFFLIKDNVGAPRTKVLKKGDLSKVATISNAMQVTDTNGSVADPEGCYLQLATNGEKVINAPFTIAGVTYFGTNRPTPINPNKCSGDLGEAYAYQFPLFCGVPPTPTLVKGGGLLPTPVGGIVMVDINGVPTKVPFLIGGGKGGSAFKPEEPKPPVQPIRSRLYWRIDNKNR